MNRLLIAYSFAFVGSAAHAADWPQFRGPNGDGHYEGSKLPLEWGPDKNVVWKREIPGKGWSSPIVWKGKIYLTSAIDKAGEKGEFALSALCVDAKTGNIDWQKEVFAEASGSPRIHDKNSHASPTPITDGERLYVHFGHMGTAALSLDGKQILWKNNKINYKPVHGNGGSPILVDSKLVFSCDGSDSQSIYALDKKTGNNVWKSDRKAGATRGFSFGTPLLVTVNGKPQIISPASDIIAAYEPVKGTEIWRIKTKGYSLIPRPVFGNGLVYFATGYNTPSLLAVKPDGKGDVTANNIAWTAKKAAPHTPSPLLVGEELYMVSDKGIASCLNAKTGEEIWSERVPGEYSASPLYHDGKIYLTAEQGQGTVLEAGKEFKILKQGNDMKERTFASLAAVDGALFVRTEKQLYRFEGK